MPTPVTATTSSGAALLSSDEIAALLVLPVLSGSVAGQTLKTLTTSSHSLRIPVIQHDPSAAFLNEGEEIPVSSGVQAEIDCTPTKLAGLVIVSSELIADSYAGNGDAASLLGQGLARDIARTLDMALFSPGMAAPAPAGLSALTGVSEVAAPATWQNLDPFIEGAGMVETALANVTAWVTSPAELVLLQLIKQSQIANSDIELTDSSSPTGRSVLGKPIFSSPAVPAGITYGVDGTKSYMVMRDDTEVTTDASAFYTSDRVAVRAKMRAGFAFAQPASVVRITRSA